MMRCRIFLALLLVATAVLSGLVMHAQYAAAAFNHRQLPELRRLSAALSVTDLALWSEARYTRHPSQADLFTPFQDFPGAREHFPAGSVIGPEALRQALRFDAAGR